MSWPLCPKGQWPYLFVHMVNDLKIQVLTYFPTMSMTSRSNPDLSVKKVIELKTQVMTYLSTKSMTSRYI